MATPRQRNQSLWVTSFLDTLTGPLDVDKFQAVDAAQPRTIPEIEAAGKECLARAGPQLVLDFLRKVGDTEDTVTKRCKYYVYGVLIDLTSAAEVRHEVKAAIVHQGVLQQVAADINSNIAQTCQVNPILYYCILFELASFLVIDI
eukprot:GHVU01169633.1.p1 GENE.GHVU01169633.1~~GHVU01169633.1.p1  ORF type:complete len:146 (+),score=13.02 GHVU01169633.1:339-776(+)